MSEEVNYRKEQAVEYLHQHRIMELFEDICTSIIFKQPEDLDQFVIDQLKLKKQQGFKTGIFNDDEIGNIFTLFDLKKDGYINKNACKNALKVLANSEFQFDSIEESQIPDKVDVAQFSRLCETILGIKQQ